jgi:exosome complex component RRP40
MREALNREYARTRKDKKETWVFPQMSGMFCVLPGDVISLSTLQQHQQHVQSSANDTLMQDEEADITIGPGLMASGENVVAVKRGHLEFQPPNRWWINNEQMRYVAALHDLVIGVIKARLGEAFAVDIGTHQSALLPYLSFEGATKRNRPSLKPGQLVYARVCLAHKDIETELTCVSPHTQKAEGMGELKGGLMVDCSSRQTRVLMDRTHPLLTALGERFPFEVAVGMNGKIWVCAGDVEQTMNVQRVLKKALDAGLGGVDPEQLISQVLD